VSRRLSWCGGIDCETVFTVIVMRDVRNDHFRKWSCVLLLASTGRVYRWLNLIVP
jgi:hypothetical protein